MDSSLRRKSDCVPGETEATAVLYLIERLEIGERSNALDVLIEVALFRPDNVTFDAVPNNAGTKVIYANRDGSFATHWAADWSLKPAEAIKRLKARTAAEADSVGMSRQANEQKHPDTLTQTNHAGGSGFHSGPQERPSIPGGDASS